MIRIAIFAVFVGLWGVLSLVVAGLVYLAYFLFGFITLSLSYSPSLDGFVHSPLPVVSVVMAAVAMMVERKKIVGYLTEDV